MEAGQEVDVDTTVIKVLETTINCYLVHLVAFIGIFGNILSLVTLSSMGFKDTSNIVLLSLAACDLFYLVDLSTQKMACIMERFDPVLAQIYQPYMNSYVFIYGRLSMLVAVSHIVVISIERLLAVLYPLKVSQWVTRGRMCIVLVCVYLFWIILLGPWLVSYCVVEWKFSEIYNKTLPFQIVTDWYKTNRYVLKFFRDIIINVITGLFCLLVTVNCFAIAYKLQHIVKQRQTMTLSKVSRKDSDIKISRMLLIVCIVYCFCNIPSVLIILYLFISPETTLSNKWNTILLDLEELIMAINATADFFIYILMSAKFYKSVINLFASSCTRKSQITYRSDPQRRFVSGKSTH